LIYRYLRKPLGAAKPPIQENPGAGEAGNAVRITELGFRITVTMSRQAAASEMQ
jgi:hypothetical protein